MPHYAAFYLGYFLFAKVLGPQWINTLYKSFRIIAIAYSFRVHTLQNGIAQLRSY